MNKAIIFDMDGVIIDSERAWEQYGSSLLAEVFGQEIAERIGDTIGMTVNEEYEMALRYGATVDKDDFLSLYDKKAAYIYSQAIISQGLEELVSYLIAKGYKVGLVSSSRMVWINCVLPRLSFNGYIECIISLNDRPDLKPKPFPDGYIEAMQRLGATPETTIIVEDSNRGIQAAKASGALAIGLRQNIVGGYEQEGADIYADTIIDVIRIIEGLK